MVQKEYTVRPEPDKPLPEHDAPVGPEDEASEYDGSSSGVASPSLDEDVAIELDRREAPTRRMRGRCRS